MNDDTEYDSEDTSRAGLPLGWIAGFGSGIALLCVGACGLASAAGLLNRPAQNPNFAPPLVQEQFAGGQVTIGGIFDGHQHGVSFVWSEDDCTGQPHAALGNAVEFGCVEPPPGA